MHKGSVKTAHQVDLFLANPVTGKVALPTLRIRQRRSDGFDVVGYGLFGGRPDLDELPNRGTLFLQAGRRRQELKPRRIGQVALQGAAGIAVTKFTLRRGRGGDRQRVECLGGLPQRAARVARARSGFGWPAIRVGEGQEIVEVEHPGTGERGRNIPGQECLQIRGPMSNQRPTFEGLGDALSPGGKTRGGGEVLCHPSGRVQTPIREHLLGTKERVQCEGALIGLRQQDRRELEDLRGAGFRRAGGFQRDDGQWARRREKIRQARNIAFRGQRLQARTTRVLRGAGIRFRRRFRP